MASWALLDDKTESELHKTRLLNVEEKPFKRITKRLGSIFSAASKSVETHEPSSTSSQSPDSGPLLDGDGLQIDLGHDFAAFDNSIARFQFLQEANQRERGRYEADQQRILGECRDVRTNNARLREQLDSARATLAQRKKFDELAEKITSSRLLRPREDQVVNLAKLEEECKELERESETYSETWRERRDQFNRIMDEGRMLRRQIRDEKEEVDRREGMNEDAEDEGEADKEEQTPRNAASDLATPHADADSQLKAGESFANTPHPGSPRTTSPKPNKSKPDISSSSLSSKGAAGDEVDEGVVEETSREDVEMNDGQPQQPSKEEDKEGDEQAGGEGSDSMEIDE